MNGTSCISVVQLLLYIFNDKCMCVQLIFPNTYLLLAPSPSFLWGYWGFSSFFLSFCFVFICLCLHLYPSLSFNNFSLLPTYLHIFCKRYIHPPPPFPHSTCYRYLFFLMLAVLSKHLSLCLFKMCSFFWIWGPVTHLKKYIYLNSCHWKVYLLFFNFVSRIWVEVKYPISLELFT